MINANFTPPGLEEMDDFHTIPDYVLQEWAQECDCCPICDQQILCDDIMAGGICQRWCECEERENVDDDWQDWPDEEF